MLIESLEGAAGFGCYDGFLKNMCELLGADYVLFWSASHGQLTVANSYTSPDYAQAIRDRRGDNENFVTRSRAFVYRPGEGCIGRVFQSRGVELVRDASVRPDRVFMRATVARRFDIQSVRCILFDGGVLEYGSTDYWFEGLEATPDIIKLPRQVQPNSFQVMPNQHFSSSETWVRIQRIGPPPTGDALSAMLKTRCHDSGADFALYWVESHGRLSVVGHYDSPRHAAAARAARGDEDTFASKSFELAAPLSPGECAPGRVYHSRGEELIREAVSVPKKLFARVDLAREFGIQTIKCIFLLGGVLECGGTVKTQLAQ